MKIVINKCHGGFGLSDAVIERYAELSGLKIYSKQYFSGKRYYVDEDKTIGMASPSRTDPVLIRAIEELGTVVSSGLCAELAIIEIPESINWEIEEYDGMEWVAEVHRTWS